MVNRNVERISIVDSRLKHLRITIVVMVVFLFLQYELGMATSMANQPSINSFSFSIPAIIVALKQVGFVALLHAGFGTFLVFFSIISLTLAIKTKVRSLQILSTLSFLTILFAAGGGIFFVLSGFKSDNASHTMATNFLLTYTFYLIELYYAKPTSN